MAIPVIDDPVCSISLKVARAICAQVVARLIPEIMPVVTMNLHHISYKRHCFRQSVIAHAAALDSRFAGNRRPPASTERSRVARLLDPAEWSLMRPRQPRLMRMIAASRVARSNNVGQTYELLNRWRYSLGDTSAIR